MASKRFISLIRLVCPSVLLWKVIPAQTVVYDHLVCFSWNWLLLIFPAGSVQRRERCKPEGHGLSDFRSQCRGAVPEPELQTAGCRWSTPLISASLHCTKMLIFCTVVGHCMLLFCCFHWRDHVFVALHFFERGCCVHVCVISANRAEGAQQLPDDRGNDIRDPRAESRVFWVQSTSGENKVGHKSRHTGREREGWECSCFLITAFFSHLLYRLVVHCSQYFNLQVYKERNVYVKEWKKRKRMVII